MYVCSSGSALEERWAPRCHHGEKTTIAMAQQLGGGGCSVVLEYNECEGDKWGINYVSLIDLSFMSYLSVCSIISQGRYVFFLATKALGLSEGGCIFGIFAAN